MILKNDELRLLTWNLWHGLLPKGKILFQEIEPRSRRLIRHQQQEIDIKDLQPTVCFLQEVCPLEKRKYALCGVSGASGFTQPDSRGLKFGSVGIPYNLDSGLLTLVHRSLSSHLVKSVQLSGNSFLRSGRKISLQLKENRWALLVEVDHPQMGRLLIVNLHLHHGLQMTSDFSEKISTLRESGYLPAKLMSQLRDRLRKGDRRRLDEVLKLLENLEELKSRYTAIFLGGDLNCTIDSDAYELLGRFGFRDLWSKWVEKNGEEEGLTWDPEVNKGNHKLYDEALSDVEVEDLTFDPDVKNRLKKLIWDQVFQPRRIDYLMSWCQVGKIDIQSARLIGNSSRLSFFPSDHFGVCVDLKWTHSQ